MNVHQTLYTIEHMGIIRRYRHAEDAQRAADARGVIVIPPAGDAQRLAWPDCDTERELQQLIEP